MKIKKFVMPYGSIKKLQQLVYDAGYRSTSPTGLVNPNTLRQICRGCSIKGVCSEDLALLAYKLAPLAGGERTI